MTLSSILIAVLIVFSSLSTIIPFSSTCAARLTEPKLQTAISWSDVFKVISVHKLDEWTTPACDCGDLILHGSLNVTQGWPVSNNIPSIFFHRSKASTSLNFFMFPDLAWDSYSVYFFSNSSPDISCNSGTSSGENKVHFFSSTTLFMNKSGIQLAVFMSWVLLLSSPVFFLRSRNSSTSRCQVSR